MIRIYSGTVSKKALEVKPRSLFYKMQKRIFILVMILVSMGPLLTITFNLILFYKNSWIEKTSQELKVLANTHKETIELFLKNKLGLLISVTELYPLKSLLDEKKLEKVFYSINKDQAFLDLGIIDKEGNHVAYVGPYKRVLLQKNYQNSPWFVETFKKGSYISDVFLGYRQSPHFIIAVLDPSKNWILRATVNTNYFIQILNSVELGTKGDAYIINKKGELQTPRRNSFTGIDDKTLASYIQKHQEGVLKDAHYLYALSPLKDGDWILVLKIDLDSSLAGFHKTKNRTLFLISVASLVIIGVSILVINYLIKKLEEADTQRLEIATRMLETEKMALIGRLASNVAHEINNPLQIIDEEAGWIEDLLKEENSSLIKNYEEYLGAIQKIKQQVKRTKDITHKLLGFARSEVEEKIEVNVNDLIEETCSFLKKSAEKRHIVIRKFLDPQIPSFLTSPILLQQVFLNILNNALDAVKENGIITITSKLDTKNDRIVIEFADTGPGIPEELLPKIFEPFFTTKKGGRHVGLGLSITYSFIKRLGGDIYVRNAKQGGAIFTIFLPLKNLKKEEKNVAEKVVAL